MTEDQREIARLKKELRNAEIERDILKKAVSIFSGTPMDNFEWG
jgi:transposase